MPLELTSPSGLWLLSALAPLVLLYVLVARRERRVVSSVWLFREARRDVIAERPWRRLLPETTLLLEALALLLLALALSGPSRRSSRLDADHVAIIVDTSASMAARDGPRTRLDAARAAAKNVVRRARDADFLVLAAAREPRVLSGVERDPRRVDAALDALAVRDEDGDLAGALALAVDRLGRLPGARRVVVVTDANADVPTAGAMPLTVLRVGAPADNVALTRLDVRRAADPRTGRDRAEAFVVVENFGAARTERFVSLSRRGGGAPLASRRVGLEPHERASVVLSFEPAPEDTFQGLVAELARGDALATDDRAFALVPPGRRLPVVLAPKDADPWLRRALAADPEVELFEGSLEALTRGETPKDALVVSVGACPAVAPPGDLLVVAPPEGACLGVPVGPPVRAPSITSWNDRDPRLRFVDMDDVHVREARPLTVPHGASLVGAGGATLIADLGLSGRSGTVVSFDPSNSDWPLRASFVMFVRNVAELARTERARAAGISPHTGELLRIPLPASARGSIVVRGPSGELPARRIGDLAVAEPPGRAGFYDVVEGSTGKTAATAAVNLPDARESDLRRVPPGSHAPSPTTPAGTLEPTIVSAAWLAALLALVVVLAESAALTRAAGARRAAMPRPSRLALSALFALGSGLAVYSGLVAAGVVAERYLRFARPLWVLAAPLGVAFVALRSRRSGARQSSTRRAIVEAALGAAALTAALAAAEPSFGLPVRRMAVIVVADASRSTELSPGAAARVESEIARAEAGMRPGDELALVTFANEAALAEPLRERGVPRTPQQVPLGRDGTSLAAGLRRALAEAPADTATRLVLISDGVATRGDTMDAALASALAEVPVDVMALEQRQLPSVRVDSLRAPTRADPGESIDLRVTTHASRDAEVDVSVLRDGSVVRSGRQRVRAGEDVLFLRERAEGVGLHRYDVRLTPVDPAADTIAEDNDAATFVRVTGAARALVLEGQPGAGGAVRDALVAAAFDVEVVGPTRAPRTLADLAPLDLVVLGNVPAADLSTEQVADLAAYGRDVGGGLLLVGGDRAMGPGGYSGSPLEAVSPVSFDLKNERRRARLAEVIAIDYSGSMAAGVGSQTKLGLANEAAARSAALLDASDRLGVAHVDTSVTWTVPLGPLASPVEVGRRIRAVGPGGGGIYVDAALEAAYAALEAQQVELKHVLLFADGSDAEQRQRAPSLARAARARGITTSVVSLGRGDDVPALEQLSREGKGRFYLIEDATRLPAVFAQETTLASQSAIDEEPFRAAPGTATAATRGIDFGSAPPLLGHLVTEPRPRADVALVAVGSSDPLLATWAVGVGRVGAFTSDYAERWGAPWASWPGASRLFAQLGRELARRADDARVSVEATCDSGTLTVTATARTEDGSGDAFRRLTASVAGPGGFARTLVLQGTGPGTYTAAATLGHPGGYVVSVEDDATRALVGTTGAVLSAGDELSPTGTDHALLGRIASVTGGHARATLDGIFADRPPPRSAFRPLFAWLVVATAVSLLGSVAGRKLPAPRRHAPQPGRARTGRTEHDTTSGAPSHEDDVDRPPPGGPPSPDGAGDGAPAATTAEVLLRRRRRRQ